MIDSKLIEMLDSPRVAERKQAIKGLARSGDREALTYLAEVYRYDDDADVRELARKAGVYIRKNVPEAPVAPPPDPLDDIGYDDGYDSLYADDEDDYDYDDDEDEDEGADEPDIPLPSEIHVTPAQISRAQGYMDQVMDLNIRGNNAKATENLQKALKANPKLIYDKYAISLAATITGMDGQEAIRRLSPSAEELRKQANKSRSGASADSPVQAAMAGLMMVCAAVALVGYFLFPWVDVGGLEDPDSGMTLNEGIEAGRALLPMAGLSDQEENAARSALDAITLSPNGFSTTQYSSGMVNVLDYFGILDAVRAAFNAAGGDQLGISRSEFDNLIEEAITQAERDAGISLSIEAEPLDFTLWLVPVVTVLAALFGFVLLQGASFVKWAVVVVLGLVGIIPLVYFYANGIDSLLERTIRLGENALLGFLGGGGLGGLGLGDVEDLAGGTGITAQDVDILVNQFGGTDLLGIGFWITLGGILGVVLLPFIAMLLMPTDEG